MKDPIEIEQEATERLGDIGLWLIGALLAAVTLFCLFGFIGIVVGFAIRMARWAMGV